MSIFPCCLRPRLGKGNEMPSSLDGLGFGRNSFAKKIGKFF